MNKTLLSALALAACCIAGTASAQKLVGVTVEPATAQVGQTVTAAIDLEVTDTAYCGVRFYWGDGQRDDIKIEDKAALPYRLSHTYAKPGQYRLMAEGKSVTGRMMCTGKNVYATLNVVAAAPAPRADGGAAAARKAGNSKPPASTKKPVPTPAPPPPAPRCPPPTQPAPAT